MVLFWVIAILWPYKNTIIIIAKCKKGYILIACRLFFFFRFSDISAAFPTPESALSVSSQLRWDCNYATWFTRSLLQRQPPLTRGTIPRKQTCCKADLFLIALMWEINLEIGPIWFFYGGPYPGETESHTVSLFRKQWEVKSEKWKGKLWK